MSHCGRRLEEADSHPWGCPVSFQSALASTLGGVIDDSRRTLFSKRRKQLLSSTTTTLHTTTTAYYYFNFNLNNSTSFGTPQQAQQHNTTNNNKTSIVDLPVPSCTTASVDQTDGRCCARSRRCRDATSSSYADGTLLRRCCDQAAARGAFGVPFKTL